MIARRKTRLRATLHVGRKDACVFWSQEDETHSVIVPLIEKDWTPSTVWTAAVACLRESVASHDLEELVERCRWRLAVPGGFYTTASRPQGRWSTTLAKATANELEAVCPVALDELQTSAIPLTMEKAFVCGFKRAELNEWQQAAEELHIELEGVWTQAGALVDFAIEHGLSPAGYLRDLAGWVCQSPIDRAGRG